MLPTSRSRVRVPVAAQAKAKIVTDPGGIRDWLVVPAFAGSIPVSHPKL